MLRNFAVVVLGLFVGMLVNMVVVQINMALFPFPPEVDVNDPVALGRAIATMPAAAWPLVFVAHLGQSFVGAWVAARLATRKPHRLALAVGPLSLAAGIANAVMLSLPAWTWIEMPLYLLVAWFAGKLAGKPRAEAEQTSATDDA